MTTRDQPQPAPTGDEHRRHGKDHPGQDQPQRDDTDQRLTVEFEITVADGAQGRRLAARQAAVHDLLAWFHARTPDSDTSS